MNSNVPSAITSLPEGSLITINVATLDGSTTKFSGKYMGTQDGSIVMSFKWTDDGDPEPPEHTSLSDNHGGGAPPQRRASNLILRQAQRKEIIERYLSRDDTDFLKLDQVKVRRVVRVLRAVSVDWTRTYPYRLIQANATLQAQGRDDLTFELDHYDWGQVIAKLARKDPDFTESLRPDVLPKYLEHAGIDGIGQFVEDFKERHEVE